jgi:glycosyltransferase involved in cell wall biosynthesis
MRRTKSPLRIAFVVTALTLGGAEMMLWKLLSRIDRRRFDPHVIALAARTDTMLERFRTIGVPCLVLDMQPRLDTSWRLIKLVQALRRLRPDIVQGWLYHGNVAASAAAAIARSRSAVIWNIRGTLPSRDEKNWRSALIIRLSGWLSSTPSYIINNSIASANEHEAHLGYPRDRTIILDNGFDTDAFCATTETRASIRAQYGIAPDAVLVGLVGRYHVMKDHANFVRATALLRGRHPDVHYLLIGARVDSQNPELSALVQGLGMSDRVHLAGRRDDVHKVTAALDIACSSSAYGEGFPNVIGEAMSCGVPCVVTDVGDSARVVADTGKVVPPRDSVALASAISELIDLDPQTRARLGDRARERIVKQFSIDAITRQYQEFYMRVAYERTSRDPVPRVIREER